MCGVCGVRVRCSFYSAYAAQDVAKASAAELGMDTVPSLNIVYTEEEGYVTADVAEAKKLSVKKLSGTKFRQMLRAGEDIPSACEPPAHFIPTHPPGRGSQASPLRAAWFAFASVVKVLREAQ